MPFSTPLAGCTISVSNLPIMHTWEDCCGILVDMPCLFPSSRDDEECYEFPEPNIEELL